jgi:hypothetical protein
MNTEHEVALTKRDKAMIEKLEQGWTLEWRGAYAYLFMQGRLPQPVARATVHRLEEAGYPAKKEFGAEILAWVDLD